MAWSFRKRIKIIPGVHLNISKRGISTTIGVKGASINFSNRGTYLNTSIPGLGLYNRQQIGGRNNSGTRQPANFPNDQPEVLPAPMLPQQPATTDNIFSLDANQITSNDMQGVKDAILLAHQQRGELSLDRLSVFEQWKRYEKRLSWSYWLLYGFIFKQRTIALKADIKTQKETLVAIYAQLKNSVVELDFNFDEEMHLQYQQMLQAFDQLTKSEKIWDVTSSYANDRYTTRSSASSVISRLPVKFYLGELPDISSKTQALVWQNANGADLYFYPNFVVLWNNKTQFAIIGYDELDLNYTTTRFIEDERVPSDTIIIDRTWNKVNKNGQPDLRFKDNYQIPIVAYGNIELQTKTGLNERYAFSNNQSAANFNLSFLAYQISLIKLAYVPALS
ncbi:MAG: DUF4236 domain-containing protein [Flavobacterium sp.]|nr:MAG: DUF4236 domain-containing protein [Flavobacterium sp.]